MHLWSVLLSVLQKRAEFSVHFAKIEIRFTTSASKDMLKFMKMIHINKESAKTLELFMHFRHSVSLLYREFKIWFHVSGLYDTVYFAHIMN